MEAPFWYRTAGLLEMLWLFLQVVHCSCLLQMPSMYDIFHSAAVVMFAVQAALILTTGAVMASASGLSRLLLSMWGSQCCERAPGRMLLLSPSLRSMGVRSRLVPYVIAQASSS